MRSSSSYVWRITWRVPIGALDAGKREVNLVARLRRLFRGRFYFDALLFERRFDMRFEFVQFLPDDALQFRRRRFQPVVGDLRENAGLAAGPLHQEGFPVLLVRRVNCDLLVKALAHIGEESLRLCFGSRAELRESLCCRIDHVMEGVRRIRARKRVSRAFREMSDNARQRPLATKVSNQPTSARC